MINISEHVKDTRSRKWQITINNPKEKGYTHDKIKSILLNFKSLIYWCMSDEVGEKGTYHIHLFMFFNNVVRFSTIKNNFEGAHYEMAKGTCQQNRDYVFKEGKWENDKKKETNLFDTHEEHGIIPIERQGSRNDLADLYSMIKEGMTNYEILEENPNYIFNIEKIEGVRQMFREEKFKNTFRKLTVTYLYGNSGSGKTSSIMNKYGYSNVYRITDYSHPFDSYKGEDVIIFEEFRSSFKIQDMLNYLDGYPLMLPCRYNNKVACYTKVYVITNINFFQQYVSVQEEYEETFRAFTRRFTGGIWELYMDKDNNKYICNQSLAFKDKFILDKINCSNAPIDIENNDITLVPIDIMKEIKLSDGLLTPVDEQIDWNDL